MGSYYDLLGLKPDATEMEIRSAYGRDALRLQNAAPANAAAIRATLDEALAVLTDPEKRAEYDRQLAAFGTDMAGDAVARSDEAFTYARNGGLWFVGGALVTAGTYAFLEGTYLLAWGPLIFGGYQLVRGLMAYMGVPSAARRQSHVLTLVALVAVGLVSAGFVGASEVVGRQEAAERESWNALVDATEGDVEEADELVNAVAGRPTWEAQDNTDMAKASVLYARVADTVATATVPARLEWYRAAMAKNFREAADITREYSQLSSSSSASAVATLDHRWNARIDEMNALADRFEAEEGAGR